MNGEYELIGILARRANVIAWAYEAKTDCLTYWLPQQAGASRIENVKKSVAASEWQFLWGTQATGSVDVHSPHDEGNSLFRLTYRRLENEGGVVGVAEPLSSSRGAATLRGKFICDEDTLLARIDNDMLLLRAREKGVLFILGLDVSRSGKSLSEDWKDKAYEIMEDTLYTEFRDNDILGLLSEERFSVFFRGTLSIDVVEERAQHFLDEFSRRASDRGMQISCSIGIAVAGKELTKARELIAAAGQAFQEIRSRGTNRYRMFESEKY